jgi:hypothetical protein
VSDAVPEERSSSNALTCWDAAPTIGRIRLSDCFRILDLAMIIMLQASTTSVVVPGSICLLIVSVFTLVMVVIISGLSVSVAGGRSLPRRPSSILHLCANRLLNRAKRSLWKR